MNLRRALLGAATLLALVALPSAAHAGFRTGVNETGDYTSTDAAKRDRAFDTTVGLDAGMVRLDLGWRSVATTKPANPSDPNDPAYDFSRYDAAVQEAAQRNLRVMFTFYGAPEFAQGSDRPKETFPGTWKPDPAALGDFAKAVATRYSGSFNGLPRVSYYEAWNEPNLDFFLAPQYEGGQPFAPGRYRELVNAVAGAVDSVHADNRVIAGSTAPYGDPPGGIRTRPLAFLRDFLCLNGKGQATACAAKPSFDIFSHHPINLSGPPRQSAIHPDDASSADMKQVRKTLRDAERAGTIDSGRKRHPLWVTEFWWETRPDDRKAAAIPGLQKHGRWIEEAMYLFWKHGADAAVALQLYDAPYDPQKPEDTFQAGLFFENGKPKPAATAFRFPFVTERRSKRKLVAWGKAPKSGKLKIQRKQGKRWRQVKRIKVKEGKVFETKIRERGREKLRARIKGEKSLVWKQGRRRDKIIEVGRTPRNRADADRRSKRERKLAGRRAR